MDKVMYGALKIMRILVLWLVLVVFWVGPVTAALCPGGDLDGDCKVGWEDIQVFAEQWLDAGGCSHSGCADFDSMNGVDLSDFSTLAAQWGHRGISLVINEFMASNSNDTNFVDPQGEHDDWIEIYNFGNIAIDIGWMYLTDDLSDPTKWQIPHDSPSETTIGAHSYLLIWADDDTGDNGTADGGLHANFKLSADGENIALFSADGMTMINAIVFDEQATNISYGRYPDANDDLRFFATPTPEAENDGAYLGIVEDPEFSHERGFYKSGFDVTIATTTRGADVYYTMDGSEPIEDEQPSATSSKYTGAIDISSTACMRAVAIKTGWIPSRTTTHTYIFDASDAIKSIPVVSLVGDEYKTFFEPDGVMAIVGGYYNGGVWQSGGDPDAYNNPIQRGRAYERPVSFEIIDLQAGTDKQIDCGIRVAGSNYHRPRYTRGDNWDYNYDKFSLKLFFRNTYGDDKLDYPIFPLADTDSFKAISLRGGHNDVHNPFIKDEMLRRLHKDMGGVAVTGTVANLFLNGQRKSFYNPCERLDHDFFRGYYDVDTDWDVITQLKVRNGDNVAWNATQNFFRSNDLFITAHYDQAGQMIDIVDFIDYLIIQLYSANWDWPNNNWTVSRERTPQGKFRFHCWDMEGTMEMQYLNSFGFDDFPSWGPGGLNGLGSPLARLYRALKANSEFRNLFADRIQKHFFYDGVLTPANIERRFTELRQQMSQVLPGMNTSILTSWIPNRHQIMLDKFTVEDLFPNQGPALLVNGSLQHGGQISLTDQISMAVPDVISYIDFELVPESAPVRVRVPIDNSLGLTWTSIAFVPDSSWTDGSTGSGVGYERGSGYGAWIDTDVYSQMYGGSTSVFTRTEFGYDGGQDFDRLELQMRYDDGFIAYLNGTEVYRSSNVYNDTPGSASAGNHEAGSEYERFDITGFKHLLIVGTNVLAIHGVNTSNASSDMLVMPRLVGQLVDITHSSAPIWYTTDGSDPRLQGGSLNPTAVEYTDSFTLSGSRCVKARALDNGQWSALNEAVFAIGQVANNLRITEIMYHPQDTNEPDDPNEEFIELQNTGAAAIYLNLVRFTNGIDFTFGPVELAAGGHILVVNDLSVFEAKYGTGKPVAGQYIGSLANNGERIRLEDAIGTTILDFSYKDGWRSITDGDGYSLSIIEPANPDPNSWGEKDAWRPSAYINGSPGTDDSSIVPNPGAIVINEVMAHSHDWIELYNTTTGAVDMGDWYLSDSDSNLMKYRIASGTVIGPDEYLVFYEDANFGSTSSDPGRLIPFALSENGEVVSLASVLDANSVLTGYRQREDFGASETGVSFGRYYKASTNNFNFVAMEHSTPNQPNAYPKVGPIVITETLYHPDWPAGGSYNNDEYEYIELHNISSGPVTLYDDVEGQPWKFNDGIDFTFPASPDEVTIPAGGCILVVKDLDAFSWRYPGVPSGIVFGPYDGWLANGGERVELGKPGDEYAGTHYYIRVDRVQYSDGSHPQDCPGGVDLWPTGADGSGNSLTRTNPSLYGNDPNNWQALTPTPGL